MAQHKLRSRIAQFKQPFLVGAVTSAALLSGCGGETQGTTPGTSDECPTQAPKSAQTCGEYESGLECAYDEESSCPREFRCDDGAWDDVSHSCNPPPPDPIAECPEITPASGEACDEYEPELDCAYNDESGCRLEFKCDSDVWEDVSPTCNPPPPELDCPQAAPAQGETCGEHEPGLECVYGDDSSCPQEFICNDGAWDDVSSTCNPPPPESECPEQRPRPGDSCEGYELGLECESAVNQSSCPEPSVVFCGSYGEWEGQPLSCNPPPPEPLTDCPIELPAPGDSCYGYEVWLTCGADASCDGGLSSICNAGGVWEADIVFCNPPAVIGSEAGVDAAADARVDAGVDAGEPDGG